MQNVDLKCNTQGEDKKYINNFVGKAEEKRPTERFKQSCEDNIKTDLKEIWYEDVY
jgi:hypothetical protein